MIRKNIGLFLISVFFLLIGITCLNNLIIYTPDSARYLIWANSLARLQGFIDTTEPDPVRYVIHAPLYPILLVPSALLFPDNVVSAKAMTLFIGCLTIIMLFVWLRQSIEHRYAIFGCILLALNPLMLTYSTQMLSDVPFLLCLILLFYFIEKILTSEKNSKAEVGLIVAITAGILTREIGTTLLISVVFFLLLQKKHQIALKVFLIPLIFYGAWFIRNEIVVANIEKPAFRNTTLFLSHFYTLGDSSLLHEFLERINVNVKVYAKHIGKILFVPGVKAYSYTNSFICKIDEILEMIFQVNYFVISAITLGFMAVGVWAIRKSKLLLFIIFFTLFYCCVILIYPINDVRFLFPLIIVIIYLFVIGVKGVLNEWQWSRKYKLVRYLVKIIILYMLLVNVNAIQSYVRNNIQYTKSPEDLYQRIKQNKIYPETYTKPFHLASSWIIKNSDSSDVILSRKELALWSEGRKVVLANPRSTIEGLQRKLRDYNVKYLVSVKWCLPINEYENLLVLSDKYDFKLVHTIADIEIFKIKPKESFLGNNNITAKDTGYRNLYDEAIRIIENEPLEAEKKLRKICDEYKDFPIVKFNLAVAKEFIGQLDSASYIFDEFRSLAQAGIFLQQVLYHKKVISQLKKLEEELSLTERAKIYQMNAVDYWILGYYKQAQRMLKKSLELDSNQIVANIFSILFPLQMRDTLELKNIIKKVSLKYPDDIYVKNTMAILNCYDSLNMKKPLHKKSLFKIKIADSYINMGLQEFAIDELISILMNDPYNKDALNMLIRLYEDKRYYWSAKYYSDRLQKIFSDGNKLKAQEQISQ